jgi:lipoyl-dependent peroxiredoxin
MALSAELTTLGTPPERVSTTAAVTLEKQDQGFAVTAIHLDVTAKMPGAAEDGFQGAATKAKTTCPFSKVLNAAITMTARLEP